MTVLSNHGVFILVAYINVRSAVRISCAVLQGSGMDVRLVAEEYLNNIFQSIAKNAKCLREDEKIQELLRRSNQFYVSLFSRQDGKLVLNKYRLTIRSAMRVNCASNEYRLFFYIEHRNFQKRFGRQEIESPTTVSSNRFDQQPAIIAIITIGNDEGLGKGISR